VKTKSIGRFLRQCARAAGLIGIVSASSAFAAPPTDNAEALARNIWSESIVNTPVPSGEGCFMAEYPSTAWMPVGCTRAPDVPFVPQTGGADYAAAVTGLFSKTVGSFPVVTGVTSETGSLGANDYSLQINSNFMSMAPCYGHSGCGSWQQFIYASGRDAVFMQYWLINYRFSNERCPPGWISYANDCYANSRAIQTAPRLPISDLSGMKLSGSAVSGGLDTVVFTGGGLAYRVSQSDSLGVNLATTWRQSEFNILGDSGGAYFNPGSHITVKVVTTGGGTPTCPSNAGTSGDTNNLNLGTCSAFGGTHPHITFVESN
jgi:hypothetical protein